MKCVKLPTMRVHHKRITTIIHQVLYVASNWPVLRQHSLTKRHSCQTQLYLQQLLNPCVVRKTSNMPFIPPCVQIFSEYHRNISGTFIVPTKIHDLLADNTHRKVGILTYFLAASMSPVKTNIWYAIRNGAIGSYTMINSNTEYLFITATRYRPSWGLRKPISDRESSIKCPLHTQVSK